MGAGRVARFLHVVHPWRLDWDSQNLLLLPEAGREVRRGRVPGPEWGWASLKHSSDGQESGQRRDGAKRDRGLAG